MGANAATKFIKVVDNVERILAVELLNAAQAIEFRRPAKTSPALEKFIAMYRKQVRFIEEDVVMYKEMDKSLQFIKSFDVDELL